MLTRRDLIRVSTVAAGSAVVPTAVLGTPAFVRGITVLRGVPTPVIDVSRLTQSTVAAPSEAEGFADAFDIGAI